MDELVESHPSKYEGWGTRLESMSIKIDKRTPEQEEYLAGWNEGT
jgi:S-adenosylhomocysteine hydrolase